MGLRVALQGQLVTSEGRWLRAASEGCLFWGFQFVMSVAGLSFSSGKSPLVKGAMTGSWQRFENIKKPTGKEQRTASACSFRSYPRRAGGMARWITSLLYKPGDLS